MSKSTSARLTPSTRVSAFFTVMGHAAQLMPGTTRVTVFCAARAGALMMASKATRRMDAFMQATVTFDDAKVNVEQLTRATAEAGYPSSLKGDRK